MQIIKNKYIISLLIIFLISFLIICLFWFSNPRLKQVQQLQKRNKELNNALNNIQQQYANDSYGGTTPEETYHLFLDALKKQDIDLASKYFILDKQEEYKNLFTQIKNSGQWDNMMNDLLDSRNSKGKMEENGEYKIEIVTKNNELIASIIIKKPILILGSERHEISNLWKITQF